MRKFSSKNRWARAAGIVFAGSLTAGLMSGCVASSEGSSSSDSSKQDVSASELTGVIYYMIPQSNAERFEKYDAPAIEAGLKEIAPNVEFKTINANGESATQQAQVETVIAQQPLAVIFGAANTQQAAGMLNSFKSADIPVVNYASQADGGPLDYYVTVPFLQIGQTQGKYFAENLPANRPVRLAKILGDPSGDFYFDQATGFDEYIDPLVADGTVQVVCQSDVLGYSTSLGTTQMEQCLQKTGGGVDAVLGMNDSSLTGVAAAIAQGGLQDKIKIYGGYDATLEAVQRVLAGWQGMTLVPPYKAMGKAAAELAVSTVSDYELPDGLVNGEFDNSFAQIPTAFVENIAITPDNVQETVVDAGLFTKDELCGGVAVGSAFCTT